MYINIQYIEYKTRIVYGIYNKYIFFNIIE